MASAATHWRDSDLSTEVVVLAEHLDGSGRRIELQRTCSPDEQDRALGLHTYCLVTESGTTHYGGIDPWAVKEGRLRLSLSTEAATALGLDTALSIRLPQTTTTARWLKGFLQSSDTTTCSRSRPAYISTDDVRCCFSTKGAARLSQIRRVF